MDPMDVDAREKREEGAGGGGEEETGDVVVVEDEGEENKRKEETALGLEEMELVKKVGFARLKGVEGSDIDYLLKKYEIFIGRKSKSTPVDVVLGNSMSISRKHAKISYNFDTRNWELTILGKNGVSVGKILYAPSSPPVVLHSQDLLQFGDKLEPVSLYFLLPLKERA
ncbi:FHA domain-containing protein [Chloropicon primus]|uniref:FHA domain-containing protein n=2 Tax=Chloropicon primus TaxID=1764295 RepID=A0A5B8MF12_9CHLO|nr:hypothetical protein A3770_02p15370 [Chloropicon primus]UPQ98228.1 FHA domain-containing protein [Chloropicon primus]|eukprot:QDZ19019.1 hypothetical protein A3770_02p15370 [Chloropicon primus]